MSDGAKSPEHDGSSSLEQNGPDSGGAKLETDMSQMYYPVRHKTPEASELNSKLIDA